MSDEEDSSGIDEADFEGSMSKAELKAYMEWHYQTGSYSTPYRIGCCNDVPFKPVLSAGVVALCCTECGKARMWFNAHYYKQARPQEWEKLMAIQREEDERDRRVLFRIRNAAGELGIPNCKVTLLVRNLDDSSKNTIVTDDNMADIRDAINEIVEDNIDDDDDDDDTESETTMKTIDSGARCCPKCKGTTFDKCTCDEDKSELKGCNLRCKTEGCDWHGFATQLVVKQEEPTDDSN